MRIDPPHAQIANRRRDPRIAIGIIYPTGSIYLTNRAGLSNVPGNVVEGCVTNVSSSSQTLSPDQRRTTIGSLSFTAVDLDGAITDEIRDQLLNQQRGIRRREVRVYTGDTDDFDDYVRVDTYVIDDVRRVGQSYEFQCADRSREQRVEIFDVAKTRLASTVAAGATTINVLDTSDFELLAHTAAFTDAPSATVGYIVIKQTGSIIRYTGKTSTSFTGCTWERFGSPLLGVEVTATENDKKPEVEEFIYLEMPAPQLDYAIKTGKILGTSDTLPSRWHTAIDEAHVDSAAYNAIGTDLFDPSDHTAGLVLRFTHLTKTDGKRFCEEQLHVPMGTFCPVSTMGVLGLRRLAALVPDAGYVDILYSNNVLSHDAVNHAQGRVINQVVIYWNYDGEVYTRRNVLYNLESIGDGETGHGEAPPLELKLRGLHVSRAAGPVLSRIASYYFERYGSPPIELSLRASRAKNNLETGDVVRLVLGGVRDYTAAASLDRAFEIESRRVNWHTGDVSLALFGSSARTRPNVGGGVGPVLANAWYSSAGVAANTVLTIVSDHVTANGTLTGGSDLRTAVFYHLGDLTIDAGVTVSIDDNVQLRVMGVLTNNGTINGNARGIVAETDPNTVGQPYTEPAFSQHRQTLGSTRGSDSLLGRPSGFTTQLAPMITGAAALNPYALEVDASGNLLGLPAELRGTPGVYGMPVLHDDFTVGRLGGAGGVGGAGLAIVCRGLVFGVNGQIDLSGGAGTAASGTLAVYSRSLMAGGGGGGSAGGLLVVVDGDDVTYPDLDTTFVADHGATTQTGSPVWAIPPDPQPAQPWTGFYAGIGAFDMRTAARVVQYVPSGVAGTDQDAEVPPPTSLAAAVDTVGVNWTWDPGAADASDYSELWVATTNDRTGAVLVSRRKSSSAFVASSTSVTRFGWVRNFKAGRGYSEWEPVSSTGGVSATYGGQAGVDGDDGADAVMVSVSPQFAQWTQAPNGGAFDPSGTTCDITFTFKQAGSDIATHVIRVTRSGTTLTAATQSESGEATAETIVGGGTSVLTVLVQHTASGVTGAQAISVVVGGDDGAPGADGDDGADGEDFWTPVLSANMARSGKTFSRSSGSSAWDSGFYSANFFGSCQVSWQPAQADKHFMIGLNGDPSTDHDYATIDYALYCTGSGGLQAYENGVHVATFGSYSAGDALAVQYDGQHVRYVQNGTVLRTVSEPGTLFAADSSFFEVGAQANNVIFAPTQMGKIDLATQIFNQLSTAFAAAGLINTNISVAADGSLVGAGGGAPVISSLSGSVATGQLTANVLAALQAVIGNLAAIKADIGSITAGSITFNSTGAFIKLGTAGFESGIGFYVEYNGGTPRLFLGNAAGNYVSWDGSALEVVGDISANRSLTDWGPTQTFTPSYGSGFSSAPTGDLNYAVSQDGLWATLWTIAAKSGTSNAGGFSITNLPAAIRPAGASNRWVQALGVGINGTDRVAVGARLWEASHGSAGNIEFATLANNGDFVPNTYLVAGWNTSGTKGLERGLRFVWPLL